MRKSGIICFAVLSVVASSLSAQTVDFGIRAGASYATLVQKVGTNYESGSKTGFSIAGIADIPLAFIYERFSFRPEIAFVNQGGSWYSGVDKDGMALFNKCWYNSLNIPLNIVFTYPFYDFRISLYAGPSLDFSLFGKMSSRQTDVDLNFGGTEEKDLKPFDLGVSTGFAVEYSRYFFSIHSNLGTLDRRATKREGESAVYQNNVALSLGYYFRR
ncbi:MAG: PorT family protein [Tannerellaceae bacterium]|jgi:hypothetical protein|nr:PorT family protein [Tannerellaceae bacterium]